MPGFVDLWRFASGWWSAITAPTPEAKLCFEVVARPEIDARCVVRGDIAAEVVVRPELKTAAGIFCQCEDL